MHLQDVPRRDKRQTFLTAVAVALLAFIIGAPVVEAQVNRVKLAGGTATAKIKDSTGGAIESEPIDVMGLTQAEGSSGAIAVRNFAGGGGLLGAGDCTASTEPAQGPLKNTVTLSGGHIVTGIIITGTGTVRITTQAVGQGQVPLANFTVNAENPNEFVGLGNGLSVTTPLTFTGIDGTACNFVIIGQGPGGS
jgi:hypothetical protein